MQPPDSDSDEDSNLFAKVISRMQADWLAQKRCQVQTKSKEIYSKDFDTTFSDEVRALMYVCGDVRNPKGITVLTVLKHLRNYLNKLLADANRIAYMRRDKFLEHQSILFLLRKDKEKLGRLIKYMKIKDYKCAIGKKYAEYEILEDGPRVHDCVQFLLEIFTPTEVKDIRNQNELDPISQRRLQRNDSRTRTMSNKEYMEFSEKQQCSFVKDGLSFFGNWLLRDHAISLKPTTRSLEIINFLMRDYIAEVIDEALLQRESQQKPSHSSSSSPKYFPLTPLASPGSRLSGLKEKSDRPPSVISVIVNSYLAESSQSQKCLKEEDDAILPEEIDSAVHKLQAICSPFTVIKRSGTAQKRTSSGTLLKQTDQALSGGRCESKFLSIFKTISTDEKSSTSAPTSPDIIVDYDSSRTKPTPRTVSKKVTVSNTSPTSSDIIVDFDSSTSKGTPKTISKKVTFSNTSPTSSDIIVDFDSSTSKGTPKTVSRNVKLSTIAPTSPNSSDIIVDFDSLTTETTSEMVQFSTNAPESSTSSARKGDIDSSTSNTISKKMKFSTIAAKSSTSSDGTRDFNSSKSCRPRRKTAPPERFSNFDLT